MGGPSKKHKGGRCKLEHIKRPAYPCHYCKHTYTDQNVLLEHQSNCPSRPDRVPIDLSEALPLTVVSDTSVNPGAGEECEIQTQPDSPENFRFSAFEEALKNRAADALKNSDECTIPSAAAKLYVLYPWQKKMQELPIPNSNRFLSILFLPKASDNATYRYNDLEDTLSRADAWCTASQASGVPIIVMNTQTESLLTKITGETVSSTVNAHGIDIEAIRAVRLWYAPLEGEIAVEIKIHEGDLKLGFAIDRTEEGFISVTSVIDDDEDSPATRSNLNILYREASKARKQLIISRISNEKVLPWMVSSGGAIGCYDATSLSENLSLHLRTKEPISLHVFVWDQEVAMLGNANLRTQTSQPVAMHLPQSAQTATASK